MTSLGVGRMAIAPTAINGGPGILCTGATKVLSAALSGMTGKLASTIVVAAKATTFGTYLWRFGTGDKNWFCFNTAGAGYQVFKQSGTGSLTNTQVNKGLRYPRVVTCRFDDALTPDIVSTRQQGLVGPATPSGTDAAGALAAGSLYLGSNSNGTSPLGGHLFAGMAFSRYLSDSECTIAEQYMNALMGQSFRREVAYEGDSLIACSSAGGQQFRARVESNYQAEATIDGRWWYFANGWNSPANVPFTNDYCNAGSGATIAIMRTNWNSNGLGVSYIPDVMIITIGTNDIAVSGHSNATVATNLEAALIDAKTRSPNTALVVEKLFPRNDGLAAQVLDYNTNYIGPAVAAAQAAGCNVVLRDTWPTLGTAIGGYTFLDGVHIAAANTNAIGDAAWVTLKALVGA